jgi:hypothetical protein
MKKFILIIFSLMIALVYFEGCSTDKSPMVSVSHPEDWNTADSENSHGAKVLAAGYTSCKSCHGADLKGGEAGYSCFECHQTYPHPESWNIIGDANFHGNSSEDCKSCHGQDLKGGSSGVSCFACHTQGSLPSS